MTDAESPTQRALAYVERCQREAGDLPGLPPAGDGPATAAVVGAGTMGGGIAMALAGAGLPVALIDRTLVQAERGLARVADNYARSVRRGSLARAEADARLARIIPAGDLAAVAGADVIVEAVFEEMTVKQDIFRALDSRARPGALLGSNTSRLDIDAIASVTSRPGDVIGTHFFAPANVMKLLEVIPGKRTSDRTLARAMALGPLLGKTAVRAGNAPGFIGNAMLADYHREAFFLVEEGSFPADVDRALTGFGFAMGLFTMTDMSGLDLGIESKRRAVKTRPNDRRYSDLGLLPVDLGRLGQKTGAGWYRYENGDRTPIRDPEMDGQIVAYSARIGIKRRHVSDDEIRERCLYALVSRAAWLLDQGVAAKPGDIDAVYAAGYGWPKAKGGPLYWADTVGLPAVLAAVERFRADHGFFWEPAPLLIKLARSGGTFTEAAR